MKTHDIILKPLLTEKGTVGIEEYNDYPFEVAVKANKVEIGKAIQKLFNVRVVAVRTSRIHGKRRRRGMSYGTTKSWKKAIVRLHPEDSIDFM